MNLARENLEQWRRFAAVTNTPENAIFKFVLDNGREFKAGPATFVGKRGARGMCFQNATAAAIADPGLFYVEGYVTTHGVALQHAWNTDKRGSLFEPTLSDDGIERHYFGVVFSTDYVLDAMVANGVYGLLDGYHNHKTIADLIECRAEWRVK